MSDLFDTVGYPRTCNFEGTYSNDPTDTGGETWKGVARNKHPHWKGWDLVDSLKSDPSFPACLSQSVGLEQAVQDFYREEFWEKMGCPNMPPALALDIFDCGINCGTGTAIKMLQRVLNVMNKCQALYADTAADGQWGAGTQAAMLGYFATRKDLDELLVAFNCLRGSYYVECAEKREANEKYEFGWFKQRIALHPI
jgi:lysozyme family protein